MIYPENRFLFTIKDVSRACGISRTTLIRMEESGFITPYKTDADTGYRYYDTDNIAQIGQYQLLQNSGLSRKEITDLYLRHTNIDSFIKEQRTKIERLQRTLNALEIRYSKDKNSIFSFINIPDITCYCSEINFDSITNTETCTFDIYQNMIKEGLCINGLEPIFTIIPENFSSESISNETKITICIPVNSSYTNNPNIKTLPGCYAFSLIDYGDYSILPSIMKRFRNEISLRKLKPSGPVRIIGIVAPYAGAHISPNEYCHEFIIPVEKE